MSSLRDCNWAKVVPIAGAAAVVGYIVYRKMCGGGGCCGGARGAEGGPCRINQKIDLDKDKVASMVDTGEIGEKAAFCRCWKSNKFPYCDGSHGKHNKETGDNVGPLVITKKSD